MVHIEFAPICVAAQGTFALAPLTHNLANCGCDVLPLGHHEFHDGPIREYGQTFASVR